LVFTVNLLSSLKRRLGTARAPGKQPLGQV
jgi:hypothetical protein